jgi:hypothetical protein
MYDLDVNSARKADTSGASIKEIGKYIGEFTQAKEITSKKTGTKGIEFAFKSASGQKANLSIYTMSAAGEKYQGYDALMAIMTCMGLRNIKPVDGMVTRYDYDQKKDVQEHGKLFPDLHKPIGLLLETEDYAKQDGSTGTRMVLKNVFRAADEFTASEILDRKTSPELLPKFVLGLRHRPLKGAPRQAQHNDSAMPDVPYSDDDLIPF